MTFNLTVFFNHCGSRLQGNPLGRVRTGQVVASVEAECIETAGFPDRGRVDYSPRRVLSILSRSPRCH